MKKYIFILLTAVGLFASCTNDDINSTYTKDEHSYQTFTYNVSTQGAYDTFGSTTTLKNRFLSGEYGDFYLGVYTYIYDNEGNLVDKDISYSKAFDLNSHDFTLEQGKYTAVTVEMIVDKDDSYQSDAFEIRDAEKLSTIQVVYRLKTNSSGSTYYETSSVWYESIGVSAQEISINNNTTTISVTPKAVGCVLDCNFYNFDKCSDKNSLVLATKNCPIGRKLNPQLTGNDRFVYEKYNSGSTAELRWFRYTSDKFDATETADVYLLEEGTDLECGIGAGSYVSGSGFSWYSSKRNDLSDGNYYYAGSYYVGSSTTTGLDGGIFDTQTEFQSWYNKAKNMYQEGFSLMTPNTSWGTSVSAVQSSMDGYTMSVGLNGSAYHDTENDSYSLEYIGKGSELAIEYFFKSATTGLQESDVYYDNTSVTLDQLKSSINSKYTYVGESSGIYMYMTSDQKTVVAIISTTGLYAVAYMDVTLLNSSNSKSYAINRAKSIKNSPLAGKVASKMNVTKCTSQRVFSTKALQSFKLLK